MCEVDAILKKKRQIKKDQKTNTCAAHHYFVVIAEYFRTSKHNECIMVGNITWLLN